jgi:AcrR family transcriptional regulator
MADKYYMTISELSVQTGTPSSTIRFYLREGLIAPPLKKGKTRAYYSKEHVRQIRTLQKLRSGKNLSIAEIKRARGVPSSIKPGDDLDQSCPADRKGVIVTAAIELFKNKGYDAISINDIAERASISKGTFYKLFGGKEDLFFECAEKVFENIDNEYRENLKEKSVGERLMLRGSLFIKKHRHMIDMLNVARGTTSSIGPGNQERLRRVIANLVAPISADIEEGIAQGVFKQMNSNAVAHMLVGAIEYGTYFCEGKNNGEIDEFIHRGVELLLKGLKPISIDYE